MKLKDNRKKTLDEFISLKHLKSTKQRDIIFDEFFSHPNKHVTVDELYDRVKRSCPKIGYDTIYRTLKLFKECGLAFDRDFGEGKTRYEPVKFKGDHHDHLICIRCGKITEFENEEIENYSREIAIRNNFEATHHKVELYGYCSSCRRKR